MPRLKEMFAKQLELQERIFKDKMGKDFQTEAIQNRIFWLIDTQFYVVEELHELCRELPYMKHWKNYNGVDTDTAAWMVRKATKEYADVVHFVINMAIILQLNPTSFKITEIEPIDAPLNKRCQVIKQETTELTKLTSSLLTIYEQRANQGIWNNRPYYDIMFSIVRSMLTIAAALHLSKEDIYCLYMDKNKINHVRQDNNY